MKELNKAQLNAQLKRLSQVNALKAFRIVVYDWSTIVFAIALSVNFPNPVIYLLSLILIARSQHGMMMIIHEAAHYRLAQNRKLNELISNYFAAFPICFCTTGYRANHLKHHQYLNTKQDPDWVRKISLSEWQFPKTKPQLYMMVLKIFCTSWYKLLLLFYSFSGFGAKSSYTTSAGRRLLTQKIIFYFAVGSALTYFGFVQHFILFWVVPFFTVFPLIERMRGIAEHFALTYADDYSQTRNVLCSPIEAFVFGPNNIRFHLVHHLYPTVPQYNLPELFEILNQDPKFKARAHNNTGYLLGGKNSVWWDLQNVRPVSSEHMVSNKSA